MDKFSPVAKSYSENDCPVAKALDLIGERWTLLILRDLFLKGPRRFQDFQDSLDEMAHQHFVEPAKGFRGERLGCSSNLTATIL